ncbi:hypothetical protein QYE76_053486 [Lolium multiflorum]|uniref:Uncharacterized protein n=1 Tax=Lolium multiflorum TaxID=4521 RepID=A0AAD8SWW7_LOLMU|nr:hypothetical protein QYE76_053486 [Lolium multiflorum]
MTSTMPTLYLAFPTMHHLAIWLPHISLSRLDTSPAQMVHQTSQTRGAQTRPGRARARQSVHGVRPRRAGHVDARAAPLTSASSLCATSFTTSPATRWTTSLARGNPVHDARFADVRHVPRLTVGLHWEAKLMGRGAHTRMEPYVQTETYDLENGGSLVFERDLYLVSERLARPPPKFHGVRIHDTPTGEQQWMITADLKGSSEPPISERILFSFKACNWPDGLAHALQEGLARVCGQHIAALRGSRFAYFARHDTMGEPMAPSSHPVLMIHVQHLDLMLHETRKELELTRVHNHRAQMTLAHHAEAIRMLAKDRKSLRLQRAKKDATIRRLREKIRTLEVTVRTQQDQIQELEDEGDDIQGGDDFLSDDNDFEDDEFTDEEDYAFLESEEDGIIPIDVDENEE